MRYIEDILGMKEDEVSTIEHPFFTEFNRQDKETKQKK